MAERERVKCVMVVDKSLPVGLAVNTAGVLALSLGHELGGVIGHEVTDGSGRRHAGLTKIPIPILKAEGEVIRRIRLEADEYDLHVVDFTDVAQTSKTYEEYERKAAAVRSESLTYLGVALYGDKKPVNKLTGSLPLLR